MGYNNVRYDIENDWSQTVTHSPRLYIYIWLCNRFPSSDPTRLPNVVVSLGRCFGSERMISTSSFLIFDIRHNYLHLNDMTAAVPL